jgi:hypothetical protein
MGAPFFPDRTVEDAAVDLIRAVQAFNNYRADAERMAAELETRWAANRAALRAEVDTGA